MSDEPPEVASSRLRGFLARHTPTALFPFAYALTWGGSALLDVGDRFPVAGALAVSRWALVAIVLAAGPTAGPAERNPA